MKIDMSKATIAWLEAWKAKKLASPQGCPHKIVIVL